MDYLKRAREKLAEWDRQVPAAEHETTLLLLLESIIFHLEAQSAASSPATETSETPSSQDTEQVGEISLTSVTFSTSSYLASPNGLLMLSVPQVIWDSHSSTLIRGIKQEEEITVTLSLKGGTPLSGSPSPSTEAPHPSASGAPGTDAPATRT